MLRYLIAALATVFFFVFCGGVAHAGPLHQKTLEKYLEANDLDLTKARNMQATTLTKGGFTCHVYEGHWVSHCVEEHLLSESAKTTAQAAVSAVRTKSGVAPTKKAEVKAVINSKQMAAEQSTAKKVSKPWISNYEKMADFWLYIPLALIVGILLGMFIILTYGRMRPRARHLGAVAT